MHIFQMSSKSLWIQLKLIPFTIREILIRFFVECLKGAMSTDLSLDSVLYVACEEQPFIEDTGCIGNESTFYILGGTHYL